jgi:uncharacterized membrane protein YcjF (UPF0283 family)
MSTLSEQDRDAGLAASKRLRWWKFVLSAIAALLSLGILLRSVDLPIPTWVLVAAGAVLAFVFILPAFGGRTHELADSPFKRAPWGI